MEQSTIDKLKARLRVYDVICYRSHLAIVMKIEGDTIWIKGPYCEQGIDWEDVDYYNPELKDEPINEE